MSGNRCGHDRHRIRRSLVRPKGPRQPLVLMEAARAFARAIVERPRDFPELQATRETDRQRRSERLEAIGLVVMAVMVRTDLLSLVVRWKGEGLREAAIAKWTGLTARRVRRALFDLRWAGLLRGPGKYGPNRIAQPVEEFVPEGQCRRPRCVACQRGMKTHLRGKPAIRQMTEELFRKVGMLPWLVEQQKLRYAALHPPKPERRQMTEAQLAHQRASVAREVRLLAQRPAPD